MKKHFFFFLFLISSFLAAAQTYNYIGVEDGLSNRRVYAIQKGICQRTQVGGRKDWKITTCKTVMQ